MSTDPNDVARAAARTTLSAAGSILSWKVILVVAAVAALLLAIVLGAGSAALFGSINSSATNQALCTPGGAGVNVKGTNGKGFAGYSAKSMKDAAIMLDTAADMGVGRKGQIIVLITAIQESTLGANTQPTGAGQDAGYFQQRTQPGWYGTLEEVQDPAYATRVFLEGKDIDYAGPSSAGPAGYHIPGLKDIKGWESMDPGTVAQSVQISGYPEKYAEHEATAEKIIDHLAGAEVEEADNAAKKTDCAGGAKGDVKTALDEGRKLIGTPYEFGGGGANGPETGIDCSGFIQYMLASVGVKNLPRTAQQQYDALEGHEVAAKDIQPGDLIFYAKGRRGDVGNPHSISHVAMYAGNGKMIESTRYNGGTEPGVQEIAAEVEDGKGFVGVRRVPGLSSTDDSK